jgi:hypothetical protein
MMCYNVNNKDVPRITTLMTAFIRAWEFHDINYDEVLRQFVFIAKRRYQNLFFKAAFSLVPPLPTHNELCTLAEDTHLPRLAECCQA